MDFNNNSTKPVRFARYLFFVIPGIFIIAGGILFSGFSGRDSRLNYVQQLKKGFETPPDSSRPGVYWFVMDGWISKENITKDFESMKLAGIGRINMMVVNVGIPKGPVEFLGEEWLALFKHIVAESKRLGIEITIPVGPGWSGSGGPWIAPDQSMQLLVDTSINISNPVATVRKLSIPAPQPASQYYRSRRFTQQQDEQRKLFYQSVKVLAFPTPASKDSIHNIVEKALYRNFKERGFPIRSMNANKKEEKRIVSESGVIRKDSIIDLSDKLQPDGSLVWDAPSGNWTIMRFVSRNNGSNNTPAPVFGNGFESNKMDSQATRWHLDTYIGRILKYIGEEGNANSETGGLKTLHLDSWELGTQNWTNKFRQEFQIRRGYDPLLYLPVYSGLIVGSEEESERFLWDMRLTSNELILEHYDDQIKNYAHQHGMTFSIEPYVTPFSDFDHGAKADYPMGEFWSVGFQLKQDVTYSNFEATSIGHIEGRSVVQAEAFTADQYEAWKQYPWSMKNQGDWAFAAGINRFFYHVFVHKALADSLLPGMTMGIWGIHWDRKQTWWPMVEAYHRYISRCQYLLQQGRSVADILYLVPENYPQYFLPPHSALAGDTILPDRKAYNFDACSPKQLMNATVEGTKVVFPSGASYELLVLPNTSTMTPELLRKVKSLVNSGAIVIGTPPVKSPSLKNYPACDEEITSLVNELWGGVQSSPKMIIKKFGKGKIIYGGEIGAGKGRDNYPDYQLLSGILKNQNVLKNFESTGPVRYTHRTLNDLDIYFVSNRSDRKIITSCSFRVKKGIPKLWDPIDGKVRDLPEYKINKNGSVTMPLHFDNYQSYFILFSDEAFESESVSRNFPEVQTVGVIEGPWKLNFEKLGEGKREITLDSLVSWTSIKNEDMKYYSGIAEYSKAFVFDPPVESSRGIRFFLNLGDVNHMAEVKLNGHDLGVVWCKPWKIDVTRFLRSGNNQLQIRVANLWVNRLIGDARLGSNEEKLTQIDLLMGKKVLNQVSFSTYNPYKADTPLLSSGLMGPVSICMEKY